jgi:regulator of protease activity HflC (stomatin/prohibitin superfamily)
MSRIVASPSLEREVRAWNGWVMLVVLLVLLLGAGACWLEGVASINAGRATPVWFLAGVGLGALGVIGLFGLFTLEPNQARVLILFGSYKGTVREAGFHWGNPFFANGSKNMAEPRHAPKPKGDLHITFPKRGTRMKVSLRARNFNGDRLKVNDKQGNPIEIGAVIVWRVEDTAQAFFDVDDYEEYVRVQSESALRHLGSQYAYDHGEEFEVTLRSGVDEVSHALTRELEQRLAKAGVAVEEARLTHLAYAPEIAQAMLRRQQADAIIAARKRIVFGAVSMVESAVKELSAGGVIDLDPERRAAMVSNLMVVLCSDSEVRPVINTGTLYG